MNMEPTAIRHASVRAAIGICCARSNLRRTIRIALVVGLLLSAINEGDVLLRGDVTSGVALKIAMNFVVPLVVSNLGVLAGTRTEKL